MHTIEVTCTGNNGRSVMAQAIGNLTVKNFNLEGKLCFISSGTRADLKYDQFLPYDKVESMLSRGSRHGLFSPIDVDKVRYENDPDYMLVIQERFQEAIVIMRSLEAIYRDAALFNIGLRHDGKRTQTIARDDVSVVLGMQQKHVNQIIKIYSATRHRPLITTVTEYAGVDGEILDAIGNTNPKVYFEIRDRLSEIMPLVVRRFQREKPI